MRVRLRIGLIPRAAAAGSAMKLTRRRNLRPPIASLAPLERLEFDYTTLDEAMVELDAVIRNACNALRTVAQGEHKYKVDAPQTTRQD